MNVSKANVNKENAVRQTEFGFLLDTHMTRTYTQKAVDRKGEQNDLQRNRKTTELWHKL